MVTIAHAEGTRSRFDFGELPVPVPMQRSPARVSKTHGLSGALFQRSRRSTVIREGRPLQHAPGTHESIYVLPDENVQRASHDVFADGAQEALAQAKAVFGGRLVDRPRPGHTATATADCEDEASSP
ncbi:hypothetical protein CG736_02985 [Kitasatospora sp. CB02891]|nr:hypothetical protein CG736_02985 [Kitasatospora sp. CB02891]